MKKSIKTVLQEREISAKPMVNDSVVGKPTIQQSYMRCAFRMLRRRVNFISTTLLIPLLAGMLYCMTANMMNKTTIFVLVCYAFGAVTITGIVSLSGMISSRVKASKLVSYWVRCPFAALSGFFVHTPQYISLESVSPNEVCNFEVAGIDGIYLAYMVDDNIKEQRDKFRKLDKALSALTHKTMDITFLYKTVSETVTVDREKLAKHYNSKMVPPDAYVKAFCRGFGQQAELNNACIQGEEFNTDNDKLMYPFGDEDINFESATVESDFEAKRLGYLLGMRYAITDMYCDEVVKPILGLIHIKENEYADYLRYQVTRAAYVCWFNYWLNGEIPVHYNADANTGNMEEKKDD